jgi:hypothetical protein
MARATIEVTREWQQIATGRAVFSVLRVSTGSILFNETADDDTANKISNPGLSDQFLQADDKLTFVRATKDGWIILADGVL